MTQTHPITPPPELVAKLWREASAGRDDAPIGEIFNHGIYLAYAAGADDELEAVEEEIITQSWFADPGHRLVQLRAARRPKPTTLKEQALELVSRIEKARSPWELSELDTIRRALEALDD
jgi:hypothetical protein